MDVVKQTKKPTGLSKVTWMFIAMFAFILMLVWLLIAPNQTRVQRSDFLFATAKKGSIDVTVSGYGILQSNEVTLLTARNNAVVKRIHLKPGAQVSEGDIVVELDNPELDEMVTREQQELAKLNANLRQLKLNNQRELLRESANLAEINASHESAELRRTAEQGLVDKGIVSQLAFKRSELQERQLKERIAIMTQGIEQLKLVHRESETIQQERINQQQGIVANAQRQVSQLAVRADFSGVLQNLAVSLGQSVTPGQEIALVGSTSKLNALIQVSQTDAADLAIGQFAKVDLRQQSVDGEIVRIDPIVKDNMIEVEIALPDALPKSARPQLAIDAKVSIAKLNNVTYIEKPANVFANAESHLFKVDSDTQIAHLTKVTFGRSAGRYIEVLSGINDSEQFIISDLSSLAATTNTIKID